MGAKIREIRNSKGISIEQLANSSGMDYSQLARMETGQVENHYSMLKKELVQCENNISQISSNFP